MNHHERVAFLPFVSLCLTSKRSKAYPEDPKTVGEHLLRRRVQQGCLQRQVAEHLGATDTTILNWEKGWTTPEARHWPKIIDYLGCDPQH